MDRRLELHNILVSLMTSIDPSYVTDHVYFQPPANIEMQYPCIVYSRDTGDTIFANNNPYHWTVRYQIQVIDRNPDSPIIPKVFELPMCTFDRHYVVDNLNHDLFNIYY